MESYSKDDNHLTVESPSNQDIHELIDGSNLEENTTADPNIAESVEPNRFDDLIGDVFDDFNDQEYELGPEVSLNKPYMTVCLATGGRPGKGNKTLMSGKNRTKIKSMVRSI